MELRQAFLALDVLEHPMNQVCYLLRRFADFTHRKQEKRVPVLRVRPQQAERFPKRRGVPGGNENGGQDVAGVLPVDAVPGEDFVLKMYSARSVDNNGVGTRSQLRHARQVRTDGT